MIYPASAAFAAVIYLCFYCHAPASWAKTVIKTASVALLVLAAWKGAAPGALILALALCAAGDFWLSRDTQLTFFAGVGAFALGHLAYVGLFLATPGTTLAAVASATGIVYGIILSVYGAYMMWQLNRKAGALRYAVMAYVPIILAMGLAAFCVPTLGAGWIVLPAAILFMISDSVLAAELFLLRSDHPARRVTPFVIWAFYWLAQLGFLWAYTG